MRCPKCRLDNLETRRFCRECGAKLVQICPECSSENLPGDKFCGQCAHELRERKPLTFIDYSVPQSYTPKFLADKIIKSRDSIEGERKVVTVLFADVANYTSISEKLDPEEVHHIMNGCFQILLDEIHRYEGTIDKFTGDGLMAFFGAPVAHEDHAQRACYAAFSIQKAIQDYEEKVNKRFKVEFKIRMGLNSGLVTVGSIGNDLRMDYTVVGGTTNVASRLQGTARPGTILISDNTHRMVRDFFRFEPLGKVKLKGKEEQIQVYELLEPSDVRTRFEAAIARGLTRFVGRESEIAELEEAFAEAQSGAGQVVSITGEAGVGKSRLLYQFRGILPLGQFTYLEGRCHHYGSYMAYLPFLDMLRSYFEIEEGDREIVNRKKMTEKVKQLNQLLKQIIPPLRDILSIGVDDEEYLRLESYQKRDRIFEAIRDLLVTESQHRPLIVAVEDLQWIDKTSEEFLDYLIACVASARILLILLYRPEYAHQWSNKSYYRHIGVNQLSAKSSAELMRAILEEGDVSSELEGLIVEKAGGNALFLEEFIHTLLENGTIQKKDNKYVMTRNLSEIEVPDTIQGVIAARIDRLEENLKQIIQVASVIGRDFAYRVLSMVTGMRQELKSYLTSLQGLEFIYEKSLFPELEYVFKHTMTQEVAYKGLLLKRRREVHESVGRAIEKIYSDRLDEFCEILSHHYSKSGNLEKAYQYLRQSAEKASRNYSNWESFRYYKETINIINKMEETEINKRRALDIRLSMDGVMRLLGYPEDSLDILQQGEKLAKELGDNRSLASLYSGIGLCYAFLGDSTLGLEYGDKCFEQAEKARDLDLMATSAFDLCSSYAIRGEYLKTIKVAPKVIALLEKTHRENEVFRGPYNFNLYAALSAYYGHAMGVLGHFEEGEALCEKALRHALAIDNVYTIGFVEVLYSLVFFCKGDAKSAGSHAQNALKCGEDAQVAPILGMALCVLGWVHYMEGDLRASLDILDKGIRTQHDAGIHFLTSFHHLVLSEVYLQLGDLNRALFNAAKGFSLAEANNEKQFQGHSRIILGRTIAKGDKSKYQTAETNILQGIDLLKEIGVKSLQCLGYFYLGELYADMNHKESAIENLNKAHQMFQEMGMTYGLDKTRDALAVLKD